MLVREAPASRDPNHTDPSRNQHEDDATAAHVSDCVRRLQILDPSDEVDPTRLIDALVDAAERLRDGASPLARRLRSELATSTGLSPAMIEWGLTTTLSTVQPTVLRELRWTAHASTTSRAVAHHLVAVVLAGNVFSAALRALFLPLLSGACVIAKAAQHDAALPDALKRALDEVDAEIGERLQVVRFARSERAATRALIAQADAMSVYGDDSSLSELAALLRPGTRLIAHGHGLSAAFIAREQLADARSARDAADRVALDVIAYDQRGCLSPHAILVEAGGAIDARAFARMLAHESLPLLGQLLPPGRMHDAERSAGLQWQGAAAVRGELFASPEHCVSYEAEQPVRPSPGGRLVGVYGCPDLEALPSALAPFDAHLKCLGVGAPAKRRARCSQLIERTTHAEVCRIGEMQTPSFDARADGRAPLDGFMDFVDTDFVEIDFVEPWSSAERESHADE